MKNTLKLSLAVVIFMISVFGAASAALSKNSKRFASDFTLDDTNGKPVTLSGYKNKQPVLLIFWTTWCPYCLRELKSVNDKYEELAKDGLVVLAVNIGESASRVKNFIKKYQFVYSVVLDKYAEVASSYKVVGIPAYVFIDKKGYIRFQEHHFPKEEYKTLISE